MVVKKGKTGIFSETFKGFRLPIGFGGERCSDGCGRDAAGIM
jgi:hypothetical protein